MTVSADSITGHTKKTKYESLIEDQVRKTLISKGDSYFEV